MACTIDAAGNYVFELGQETYRVQKMDVFKQREMIGLVQEAMVTDIDPDTGKSYTEIKFFSLGCNALQDWLFPRISRRHPDGKWSNLAHDKLDTYLESLGGSKVENMNAIFTHVMHGLMENFTGTGHTVSLINSNHPSEDHQRTDNIQGPLSQILKR